MKRCSRCNKGINFYRRKTSPDGFEGICKRCRADDQKRSRHDHNAAVKRYQKKRRAIERQLLFRAYGMRCACCGEIQEQFLTLDHVNNDGYVERHQHGHKGGADLYRFIRYQGYPKDKYQILCMNCNFAKARYGSCPHKSLKNNI